MGAVLSLEGTAPPGAASRLPRPLAGGGAAVRGALAGFGLEGGGERKVGEDCPAETAGSRSEGAPAEPLREPPGSDQEEPPAEHPQEPAGRNHRAKTPRKLPAEAAKPNESFLAKPFFQKRRE